MSRQIERAVPLRSWYACSKKKATMQVSLADSSKAHLTQSVRASVAGVRPGLGVGRARATAAAVASGPGLHMGQQGARRFRERHRGQGAGVGVKAAQHYGRVGRVLGQVDAATGVRVLHAGRHRVPVVKRVRPRRAVAPPGFELIDSLRQVRAFDTLAYLGRDGRNRACGPSAEHRPTEFGTAARAGSLRRWRVVHSDHGTWMSGTSRPVKAMVLPAAKLEFTNRCFRENVENTWLEKLGGTRKPRY